MREHKRKMGFIPNPTILETCGDDWRDREHYWLGEYRSKGVLLLNQTVGRNGCEGHTDETRALMSERSRGRAPSEKTLNAARAARLGLTHTAEARGKMSEAAKGRKPTAAAIERSAAAHRGKKRPPEVGAKISAAKRGKSFSEAHRAALSAAKLGTKRGPQSEETKAKIAQKRRDYWTRVKETAL